MKITFVMPCVGKKKGRPYVKTWQMEPLAIAVLSALTPARHEKRFYDDRIESPDFDAPADLAAINVETYTAARAYQIAAEFRKRGVKVVMGGFHATLAPDEVAEHADCVVVGAAERTWPELLAHAEEGKLRARYDSEGDSGFSPIPPDRSIYAKYRYTPVTLVETGRGCRYDCDFCSICRFFGNRYSPRAIDDVANEIATVRGSVYFFIDDNLGADREHLKSLLAGIKPLGIRWIGQISIDAAKDPALVKEMADSGCMGVLIGFESLDPANLLQMGKRVNLAAGAQGSSVDGYSKCIEIFRANRIAIYATFLFGYDRDDSGTFERTFGFALRERFFFAAFNHLVPFPGTRLYARFAEEGRLLYRKWWLEPGYRFGDVAFAPALIDAKSLSDACLSYRRKFYGPVSLLRRALDFRSNVSDPMKWAIFWGQGITGRGDIERRQGLPLGEVE